MAATAAFASIPKVGAVTISAANTARDGTGTLGTVFTAGTSGSRIDTIQINAQGTTTAGAVRLFIHDGTTARFIAEAQVGAITASATQTPFNATLSAALGQSWLPLVLQTGYSLRASTNNAESFNVQTVLSGDF